MTEWLFGTVPYFIALGVGAAVFGVVRPRDRRTAFKISVSALALAGIAFIMSVVIGSMNSMPT